MALTKVSAFMLFSLGLCHSQFEQRFKDQPVALSLSKADFIDLVQRAGIAHKKDRALYKNLQSLEEQRYISYDNKAVLLTNKGKKMFLRIKGDMQPYIEVAGIIHSDDILKYTAKKQLVLK